VKYVKTVAAIPVTPADPFKVLSDKLDILIAQTKKVE